MDLMTYKQLLYYLKEFFKDGEFDSAEVSRRFNILLDLFDPKHTLTKRFSPRLMSNGLRRLWAWELVDRRPVSIEIVTKSGKTGHRGRHFEYWITAKGFRYLEKARVQPFSWLLDTKIFSMVGKEFGQILLAPADRAGMLPPILKGIARRPQRLPNRVTLQREVDYVTKELQGLAQVEKVEKKHREETRSRDEKREAAIREYQKQQVVIVESFERFVTELKEERGKIAEESAKVIAENKIKNAREVRRGFLKMFELLKKATGKVPPEVEELMRELSAEGAETQEPDAGHHE